MSTFLEELKAVLTGEVHSDPIHRQVYSVDASIFEVTPLAIAIPKTKIDLINAIKIADAYKIPITARGAGTGITGGCLGQGLVIDTSQHLNHIIEINTSENYAICEPGVVQDQLNNELGKLGYRLGPDTSTGDRATVGGMLANNSAGARSLKFGCMANHVLAVELILASGEILSFSELDQKEWEEKRKSPGREGEIYKELFRIREEYQNEIRDRFPDIPRRVSGYNLNELIKPLPLNISGLIAGSEGTLGIASMIKVRICPKLKATAVTLLHFHTMREAMLSLRFILATKPIAVEMIDRNIIAMGKLSPTMKNKLGWLSGDPEAILAVEFEGDNKNEAKEKAEIFTQAAIREHVGYDAKTLADPVIIAHVWEVRKAGLSLLLSKRSYQRAIAFIEDVSVAPDKLPAFLEEFRNYLAKQGKNAGIYGHAGSGCMHIRPYIDLRKSDDLAHMEKIMLDVSDLLLKYKGALSGEHGDGLIRSWLNKKMFGEKLYQAFIEVKQAFDPDNRMNPGKIVNSTAFQKNLRLSPETPIIEPKTKLDFSMEGGFALAVDLCNGNGLCRKKEKTMCPSFQATEDEYHSTRARAQTLRSIIHGKLPLEELSGAGLHDVLDLCLQCKGCKTECPSQVDMAKMKTEVLYHYHQKHGASLRDRLLGNIRTLNRISSPFAGLYNRFPAGPLLKLLNIAPERGLPTMATQRLSSWYKKQNPFRSAKKVVLISDTFTEFNSPEIGKAAIKVLNKLGYEVVLYARECCGRPLISKGFLEKAKKQAERMINDLALFAEQHLPIIGLEPSCLLTIKDDYFSLLGAKHEGLAKVNRYTLTFDEFIAKHLDSSLLTKQNLEILVHGHCHQKALIGMESTLAALRAIPGATVTEIPSGCCGMAGSFGYESEHYDLSMKIGELKLFPAIRNADKSVIVNANGFSCRHQIMHGTQRKPFHLAEILSG